MVDGVAGRGYGRLGIQAGQFTRQSSPVRSDPLVVSTDSLIVSVDCGSDALVAVSNCLGAQLAISVNNCPPPRDPRSRMTSFKRTQRKDVQKAYRVRNWREYETGLRARGSLTVWLGLTDGKLANGNSPRPTRRKPGRQRQYSNHAIETTVTVGLVFGLASRQTEGFPALAADAPESGQRRARPQHDLAAQGEAGEGCFLREANREARPPPHRQQRSFSARRPVAHSAESQGRPQAAPRCG